MRAVSGQAWERAACGKIEIRIATADARVSLDTFSFALPTSCGIGNNRYDINSFWETPAARVRDREGKGKRRLLPMSLYMLRTFESA